MFVFIDDSGDPGFRIEKGSSKVFVIALVLFDDPLEAEEASLGVKKLRRKLKVSDMYEFKFNKTNRVFREAFFEAVKQSNFKVRAIVVDKQKIESPKLRTQKEDFYNFIIMHVIKNSIGRIKKAKLKFDKRGERALRNELRVYLSRELDNKKNNVFTDIKFADSRQNTLIQLADMVAGSIFASYTRKDTSYLNQLKKDKKIEDILEY